MRRILHHRVALACAAALVLGAWPAAAHHTLLTQFDLDKPVTVRGTVTRVEWVNPHGWIHVDVDRGDGQVESWAVETGSIARMKAGGLNREDVAPGTAVVIIGFASRKGTPEAAGMTLILPARQASFALGR